MAANKLQQRVLRRKSDFENLKRSGRRYSPNRWLVLNHSKNSLGFLRFGITISGKVGHAVLRNRLRRYYREYFRSINDEVMQRGIDVNVVFRPVSADFYRKIEPQEIYQALDAFFY